MNKLLSKILIKQIVNHITGIRLDPGARMLIGIGGPGASGKSTFAKILNSELHNSGVIELDDYRLSRKERAKTGLYGSNPSANKTDLLLHHLNEIKTGQSIDKPVYDPVSGISDITEKYIPAKFNLIVGELVLYDKLSDLFDLIIIIESDLLPIFKTRLKRDKNERDYSLLKSLKVFFKSNLVDYNKFYRPKTKLADVIIKRHRDGYTIMKGI